MGRRPRIGRTLRGAALAAFALLATFDPALAARLIGVKGTEFGAGAGGYGRIVLTFDKPVAVKATNAGGVLVLGYGERTAPGPERLAEELPNYVAGVRRDPDGTGLRLALQRPFRTNTQVAGESVFVDLLPDGWAGLPPPLPPEVVAELARRARVAEEIVRARAPAPVRKPLPLELARLPTRTRLSLRVPEEVVAAVTAEGPVTRLRVVGAWTIDAAETRGRPRPGIAKLGVEVDDASASLLVTPAEGYVVSNDREDGAITLDLVRRNGEAPAKPAATEASGEAAAQKLPADRPVPAKSPAVPGLGLRPAEAASDAAETLPKRRAGAGLVFPFASLPAAALFERGGVATLAFETAEPVAVPSGTQGLAPLGEPVRNGPLTVIRFAVPPGRLIDLAAVSTGSGSAWELSAGDTLSPSGVVEPVRQPDKAGRVTVSVGLARPGAATWLDLDGERIALVTSAAQRPVGNPKSRRFVDFEILPSRHGLAVLADADDLAVRPELDGVLIDREGGLATSAAGRRPEEVLAEAGTLVIDRAAWERARSGVVRETLRGLGVAAAAATPIERGLARLALARSLMANGFDAEGLGVLEAAAVDDPLLAASREVAMLRGVARVRMGRNGEALAALAAPPLAGDPEAALWRAMAAAGTGDWKAAETGFLKVLPLSEHYPADLAQQIRATAAESAIETGDPETASARAIDARELTPWIRSKLALVRARVADATGQIEAALDAYARLAESTERPVATEAALRGTLLGQAAGKITREAAIDRLERLAVTWHGGAIEEAINVSLARLYLGGERWRDAFSMVRRTNGIAPAGTMARALTSDAQATFESLYLTDKGDRLSGVEAVALYFDFRELAPIGRRGDEIVRRLADRLVGLDLLDSAADLLQYQIDKRLTGPARSAVATRLATLRLMDGKPLRALETLDATYLPELPGDLKQARSLIRARALSDLTRTDLALEAIEDEAGPDIERLRADIYWGGRRWREAGESHEALLGETWRSGKPLDEAARADAVRAAIAYDLAGDRIGLERLKAKFAGPMAQGPDARTFALLTGADPLRAPGFRAIAARATKAETLSAFLTEYRKRYPESAVPDRGKAGAPAEGDGTGSRADAPAGPPPG